MRCALPGLFGAWRTSPTQYHTGIAGIPIDHHRLDPIDHAFTRTHLDEGLTVTKDVIIVSHLPHANFDGISVAPNMSNRPREMDDLAESIEDVIKKGLAWEAQPGGVL